MSIWWFKKEILLPLTLLYKKLAGYLAHDPIKKVTKEIQAKEKELEARLNHFMQFIEKAPSLAEELEQKRLKAKNRFSERERAFNLATKLKDKRSCDEEGSEWMPLRTFQRSTQRARHRFFALLALFGVFIHWMLILLLRT